MGAAITASLNLPPGMYSVTVNVSGFKTLRREGLGIAVGDFPVIDLILEVGISYSAGPEIDNGNPSWNMEMRGSGSWDQLLRISQVRLHAAQASW
jgi:hypothetical protein